MLSTAGRPLLHAASWKLAFQRPWSSDLSRAPVSHHVGPHVSVHMSVLQCLQSTLHPQALRMMSEHCARPQRQAVGKSQIYTATSLLSQADVNTVTVSMSGFSEYGLRKLSLLRRGNDRLLCHIGVNTFPFPFRQTQSACKWFGSE